MVCVADVIFCGDGVDISEDFGPAATHGLERRIIPWREEAGMDESNPGTAVDLS